MLLADSSVIPRPNPSEQLVLAFEYYDGKRWRHLGRSAPRGALPGSGDELGFHDDTKAMSQSGTVSFRRPKDMEALEINGQSKRWIRVRIEKVAAQERRETSPQFEPFSHSPRLSRGEGIPSGARR